MSQSGPAAAPLVAASTPRIYLVAAVAANGVIGVGGKMPWHLPDDLRHFKSLTLGHPVIMGRRTWESIGRSLPGRENIVVTRNPALLAHGARIVSSLDDALSHCAGREKVFVIGGGELYAAALPRAHGLLLTEIQRDFDGDARFPAWDRRLWREAARQPQRAADGLRFDFVHYERQPEGTGAAAPVAT